ncbi:MAG: hypothetical protein FWG90_10980 [Oscillospiraceae bacterium]|nr:hypothetical protein [Oscillospiraceae bacterium]
MTDLTKLHRWEFFVGATASVARISPLFILLPVFSGFCSFLRANGAFAPTTCPFRANEAFAPTSPAPPLPTS